MTPLFNKDTDLVGWLKKNIFDAGMNWVVFVASDSGVWNVNKKNWCGHLYGINIRDYTGKTLFWNPDWISDLFLNGINIPVDLRSKPIKINWNNSYKKIQRPQICGLCNFSVKA